MKRLTIGILAHVDSGKTTLSEGLLYCAGMLRKLGRVDHGDAFLDTHALEKSRGITIFSKQARLLYGDCEFTLLDTPGHVDFSAEAERTLSVLDYALLVVSGSEGIQPHTETLFKLLCRYSVPTFVFINKMDISHLSRQELMGGLKKMGDGFIDFSAGVPKEEFYDGLAMCSEDMMEQYLDTGTVSADAIRQSIRQRQVFPCFFGSALKLQGYPAVLTGYTKGRGRLSCEGAKYFPCHNSDEVIAAIGYDPESDTDNPADSVFCSHGAGHTVKWNAVFDNMHIPAVLRPKHEPEHEHAAPILSKSDEEKLIRIYERTYGPIRSNPIAAFRPSVSVQSQGFRLPEAAETGPEYLLVDGYNIIFAWDDLAAIAKEDMDLARSRLVNLMCNYRGLHRCEVILVFDAYRIKGNTGSFEKVNNISVVYTKEAETADSYIERTTHELSKNYRVQVATSDRMEQLIIIGNGAMRISADAFRKEVDRTEAVMQELMAEKANGGQKLMEGKISRDNKTW